MGHLLVEARRAGEDRGIASNNTRSTARFPTIYLSEELQDINTKYADTNPPTIIVFSMPALESRMPIA